MNNLLTCSTTVALVLGISQMILIGISSTYAAISYPVVIGALYFVQKVYLRTSRQLRFLDLEAKAPLFSNFSDCLSGLVTLRAFGWQQSMEERNRRLLDYSQRPFYLLFAAQRWLTLTLDLIVAGIATILIILVVTLRGKIGAGYVGVALLNIIQFSQTIKLMVTFWTNLETHIGSILRVRTLARMSRPRTCLMRTTQFRQCGLRKDLSNSSLCPQHTGTHSSLSS